MLKYRWTAQLRPCLRPEGEESSLLWAECLVLEYICLRAILYLIKYQNSLYPCTLVPFLSSYAEMLIDNQRSSSKCIAEFISIRRPIFNTSADSGLVWVMPSFIPAHLRVLLFFLFLYLYSEFWSLTLAGHYIASLLKQTMCLWGSI